MSSPYRGGTTTGAGCYPQLQGHFQAHGQTQQPHTNQNHGGGTHTSHYMTQYPAVAMQPPPPTPGLPTYNGTPTPGMVFGQQQMPFPHHTGMQQPQMQQQQQQQLAQHNATAMAQFYMHQQQQFQAQQQAFINPTLWNQQQHQARGASFSPRPMFDGNNMWQNHQNMSRSYPVGSMATANSSGGNHSSQQGAGIDSSQYKKCNKKGKGPLPQPAKKKANDSRKKGKDNEKSNKGFPKGLLELIPPKYKKMTAMVGNDPEDIKKWIESRKKNYPTSENIQKKQEDRRERLERGEPEYISNEGKMQRHRHQQEHLKQEEQSHANLGSDEGGGTSVKRQRTENNSNDEENDEMKPEADCSLNALLAYSSDTDTGNNQREASIASKLVGEPTGKPFCRSFAKGKCKRGENCPFSHHPADRAKEVKDKQKGTQGQQNKHQKSKSGNTVNHPSLLRKVLDKDIHRENSVILQCFRFFRRNDFLEEAKPT